MPRPGPIRPYALNRFPPTRCPVPPTHQPQHPVCSVLPRHRFMCCCKTSLTKPSEGSSFVSGSSQNKRRGSSLMETSLGFINWRSKKAPIDARSFKHPASTRPSTGPPGGWGAHFPPPAAAPSTAGESTTEPSSNRPPAEVRV